MAFIRFMHSTTGRLLRISAGMLLMLYGFTQWPGNAGLVVGLIGLVPVAAGAFNFCLFAPLFGGTLMGRPAGSK